MKIFIVENIQIKKRNGYGKMRYADGMIYEGYFENDHKTEKGKIIYPNGDTL